MIAKTEIPELTFPPAETECVNEFYANSRVILEYGSGGSTWLGASLPGRYIMSVESDRWWAYRTQRMIDEGNLPSPALLWYVDIGPTGAWGRPIDDQGWRRFHTYSLSVWDQPFFIHPDLVLIDGRFRQGCFAATCLRIKKPVTVLFDDYVGRKQYHVVEHFAKPEKIIGRMAIFRIDPNLIRPHLFTETVGLFFQTNYAQGAI